MRLLVSGVSLRRSAKILKIHRTTVARKLRFLADQARLQHQQFLQGLKTLGTRFRQVQFDEMESFEHTKLKPLSIPLVVNSQRKILAFDVTSMPAKGPLAHKSLKKYGPRPDHRRKSLKKVLKSLKGIVYENALFQSDQNPNYPGVLKSVFPHARHTTFKGRQGCVTGQGELKKVTWDPLFSLNHTAAMLRANINRLFRRTWCTTKIPQGLLDHLALYLSFHNHVLTP